jgi:hypothetical protein
LRRDLDLAQVVRDLEIVRERLREAACCHLRKLRLLTVRLVRDSVAVELRGTRRIKKSRSRAMLHALALHRFRWAMCRSRRRSRLPRESR